MTIPAICPVCGGRVTVDPQAAIQGPCYVVATRTVVPRWRPAVVAFCNACEWAQERVVNAC